MQGKHFGNLPTGEEIFEYSIQKGGIRASVITFGAILRTLTVHDTDVVGGFDALTDYLADDSHQGGIIGRVANRIGGARFAIDGKVYSLPKNDGENCLHGGVGFDRRVWKVCSQCDDEISLEYLSADGEEGFPASVCVNVTYRISGDALVIDYRAVADGKTPISLTNHAYFNLDGFGGDIKEHRLAVYADRYTEVDDSLIPTGVRPNVKDTPFDHRTLRPVGDAISQIGGIDHNFILSGEKIGSLEYGRVRHAATLEGKRLRMDTYTDRDGIQVYTGNFLGGGPNFKGGIKQLKHGAICLEAQIEPNSVSRGEGIFDAGETYRQITAYKFTALCSE